MNGLTAIRFHKTLLPALAVLLFLAQALLLYGSTGRDDAFITYWPALTLAEHGEILNYNGDRIEQSSTLLHTATLALLHKILPTVAMPTLGWATSLFAGVLLLLVTARMLTRDTLFLFVLASSPSLLYWSGSGMESTTAALLVTSMLYGLLNNRAPAIWLVGSAALAVIIRPEMFLVISCFIALAWPLQTMCGYADHSRWRMLLCTVVASFIAVTLWRHFYFGVLFPQPVTAKSSGISLGNVFRGWYYLKATGRSYTSAVLIITGLAAFLLALCMRKHPHRKSILTAGCLALAQMAFIFASGGDWMEATRFLLPVLPALLVATACALQIWRPLYFLGGALLLTLALYDSWHFANSQSSGFAQWEQQNALDTYLPDSNTRNAYSATELQTKDALRDIPQLEALHDVIAAIGTRDMPLHIASIQMGFIPFHLSLAHPGRLQFLDLRALATNDLTLCELTRNFPHADNGLRISYDEFYALLPQLQEQCGIHKPDIVYDMGYAMRKDVLLKNGYRFVYRETRVISGEFSKRGIGSELFIAVRKELIDTYHLQDIDLPPVATTPAPLERPTNIVLMIADDISYNELGFMGNRAARTPTLDQLAQQGTVFTTAYVPTAFCRPSLGTLLTGQWPHQNRIHANNGVISIPPGTETLATRMQQQGYRTFAGGKFWEDDPLVRGFDAFDTDKNTFARRDQDKLWQFIDQHAGKSPMFIWWAPMLPHTPHNPPAEFLQAIDRTAIVVPPEIAVEQHEDYRDREQNLLAMTLWFDNEMHKLLAKLAEENQLDNTLFVFLSDNGFSHRSVSKSFPYELGLRTPVIFKWPQHIPARRLDTEINTIDLYKTLLSFAGVSGSTLTAESKPGFNLRNALEHGETPAPEKLFGADYQAVTLKTDPVPRPERDIFALHVRDGNWKYIFFLRDVLVENNRDLTIKAGMSAFPTRLAGDEELYDLASDPDEQKNLSTQPEQQEILRKYRKQVLDWWFNTGGKPFDSIAQCPQQPAALCNKLNAVQ